MINRRKLLKSPDSSFNALAHWCVSFLLPIHIALYWFKKSHVMALWTTLDNREMCHLVKCGCSRWSKTMMMSPGSFPGSWSPSPWKTIFCPSLMPVEGQWPSDAGKVPGFCSIFSHLQIPFNLTFVNVDLQNLLLPHDLSTSTCFAAVLEADPLSLSLTTLTHRGHLLDHSWYYLVHMDLHAWAMTSHAHLCSSFPTPMPYQGK